MLGLQEVADVVELWSGKPRLQEGGYDPSRNISVERQSRMRRALLWRGRSCVNGHDDLLEQRSGFLRHLLAFGLCKPQ